MTPPKADFPVVQLLPNLLTLSAICAGLTAIRFGFTGNFAFAILLLLVACVLDGVDGKLARLLKCETPMGAELDSLADFLNFGVATPILIYLFTLHNVANLGWLSVMMYAVCCVIRLARFNVGKKSEFENQGDEFFVGVPAPAGAFLIMLPVFASFLLTDARLFPGELVCLWMVIVGLLMISRIPTYSLKVISVSRDNVKFFLLGFAFLIAALLNYPWETLIVLDLVYFGSVLWSWNKYRKAPTT